MACVEMELNNIFPVIKHHISLIERFEDKFHRDFSLIFLRTDKRQSNDILETLTKILRNSDIVFTSKKNLVIFSPGADWNASFDIANGIREFYNLNIDKDKDTIVTYPDDGENVIKLLKNLSDKIHQNHDITINFI